MLGGQNFGGILFSKGGKLVASYFFDPFEVKTWRHPLFQEVGQKTGKNWRWFKIRKKLGRILFFFDPLFIE